MGLTSAKRSLAKLLGKQNTLRLSIILNRLRRTLHTGAQPENIFPVSKYSIPNCHTFFGYYDKTPFSLDNQRILSMVAPRNACPLHDPVKVGFFNRGTSIFEAVGDSSTWHWQQGCRLQWFPADQDYLIIYNTCLEHQFISRIQHIETKAIIQTLEHPVYDTDTQGKWALSLNFSRLHRLRPGYGYGTIPDDTQGSFAPKCDGVWRVDLASAQSTLLFSLEQLAGWDPLPTMEDAEHYVNHLAFNPSGNRFMFFHIWAKHGRRYNRLITSDLEAKSPCILTRSGIVSHYCWKSDQELLITYANEQKNFGYYVLMDHESKMVPVGTRVLNLDGHPSYAPNHDLMLTDTYPDRYGERQLLLYAPDESITHLGSFHSPLKFREESRCDLHPRWDRLGNAICFDSAHEGIRHMYVVDVATAATEGKLA